MANNEKIDELISEKAFEQLDRLLKGLDIATNKFSELSVEAVKANSNIGSSKNMAEFAKNAKEAADAIDKVSKAQEEVTKKNNEAVKAERAIIDTVKAKLVSTQEETKLLNQLSGTLEQNIRANIRLKLEIKALKEEQDKLSKSAAGSVQAKQALLNKSVDLSKRELELKSALQENNLEIRRQTKEFNSAETSYNAVSSRLDQLRGAFKSLTEEERNNADVGGVILGSIKEYDKQLKALDKSMGVNNRNVGDYAIATENLKKSLIDIIPGARGVNSAIETGQGIFQSAKTIILEYVKGSESAKVATEGLSTAQKAAFVSSELLSKGLAILRLALISTGIGAMVVLLGSLIAYLTQTQEGIDRVTSVTRPLQAIFKNMVIVLGDLGKRLFDAFSNPQKLLKDLGDLLVSQVINRFKALGVVLEGLINFDLNKVSDGLFQAATGVENLTGKIQNAASASSKFLSDSIKQGQEIDRLTKEVEANEIRSINAVAKLTEEFKAQNYIAEDISKTTSEREKAALRTVKIQQDINKITRDQFNNEIELRTRIAALNGNQRSDQKELADLEKQRREKAASALEAETTQNNKLNQIRKQGAEESRKALDARINYEKQSYDILAGIALETVNDDKINQQTRIDNLELYLQYAEKSLIKERDLALNADNITAIQRRAIQEKFIEDKRKLDQKGLEESLKIFEQSYNEEQKQRADANKKSLNDLAIRRDEALALVVGEEKTLAKQKEDAAEKEFQIHQTYNRLIIEEEIKQTERLIEQAKLRGENVSDQEAKIAALKLKLAKDVTAGEEKELLTREERQKRFNEFVTESAFEVADIVSSLVNSAAQSRLDALDRESEKIQKNYDFEREQIEESLISEEEKNVKLAQLDEDRVAQEEAIEQRKREIQNQQARFAKAIAIAEIGYRTASAIMGVWNDVPKFDFGISAGILTGIVSALGAAQIATVLATPIPGYYTGIESSPEGLAYVGERGREGRINPDGSLEITPSKSTLTYLEKGTQIIPHNELNMMLANAGIDPIIPNVSIDISKLEDAITQGSNRTIKAIKSNRGKSLNITKGGWKETNRKIDKFNNYIRRNIN